MSLHLGDVDLDDSAAVRAGRLGAQGKVEVVSGRVSVARLFGDEAQLTRVVADLGDKRFALLTSCLWMC